MSNTMTLQEICRRRYHFGEFYDTHILMGPTEFAHMRRWAEKLERPSFEPDPLLSPDRAMQQLMGIPVVVNPDMPEDTWRLVKNSDHSHTLYEGNLSTECPNRNPDPMEQCYNCQMPFDTIKHRYLCPHCKTKNSCCF